MTQKINGRWAQIKVENKFSKHEYTVENIEVVDIPDLENTKTQYIAVKKMENKKKGET